MLYLHIQQQSNSRSDARQHLAELINTLNFCKWKSSQAHQITPCNTPDQNSWCQNGERHNTSIQQIWLMMLSNIATLRDQFIAWATRVCQQSERGSVTQVPTPRAGAKGGPSYINIRSLPQWSRESLSPHPYAPRTSQLWGTQRSSATSRSGTQLDVTRLGHLCIRTYKFYSISSPRFPK